MTFRHGARAAARWECPIAKRLKGSLAAREKCADIDARDASLILEILNVSGNTPEWTSWQAMRRRVLDPKRKEFPYYGGRGITIDQLWDSFDVFLSEMGPRPTLKHTLDRIDNDGPYCKANCRWATRAEQQYNTRQTKLKASDIPEVKARLASGESSSSIGLAFQIAPSTVRRIRRGERWKEII
jgi:hypothetical protein